MVCGNCSGSVFESNDPMSFLRFTLEMAWEGGRELESASTMKLDAVEWSLLFCC